MERRAIAVTPWAVVAVACLVNIGIAVDFTRHITGPKPGELERRYGFARQHLSGVTRVAYVSHQGGRFVNARYALAPTVLDPRYVRFDRAEGIVVGFDLETMVDTATHLQPLVVMCDFEDTRALSDFLSGLAGEAEGRGIEHRLIQQRGGLALVSLGG